MTNEQFILAPYAEPEKENGNFREILYKYLYHWPLFLVSVTLAICLAFFYLKYVKPVYHVKAKLSIKDEKQQSPEKTAALQELNIATTPKLVESEIEVLKSRPLISQVVQELGLWINYTDSRNDLYGVTPVRFHLISKRGKPEEETFQIVVRNSRNFSIVKSDGSTTNAAFGDRLTSSFGIWKLDPTSTVNDYVGKKINITLQNPSSVISEYQNRISTVLNKTAPIVELSIDDQVAERGTDVLNHLIGAYKNFNIADKNKETESTLKFIDERLASLTGELTDVEKNVEGYKSSVGLTDISSQSKAYLEDAQSNDSKLNEVNVQLNVINSIEKYINSSGGSENAPATIGISDPGLTSLVEQLTKLQIQRERLLAITPEDNPIFVPLNRQIKSIKTAVKENISNIKSSLLATRRQLQLFNSRVESSIKSIPGQERKYVSIKRQQGIKESLYVYLLQKREEVALSYASTLTDARTVEEAYYEEPHTRKEYPLTVALIFGLLIPAGLISGRDALRNRILTRKEIEKVTSVPIICELIQEKSEQPIVVFNKNTYAIGEQFRALRTNLLHMYTSKEEGKVMLFTSSIGGEGKSYVTSNIGASLAISGKRTIILELDMRKPKVSKIFGLNNQEPGIADLLNDRASKDEIIRPSRVHPNLFIAGSGPIPQNPSELLESEKMKEFIDELRYEFDNILIDSPPLRLVTDAQILARFSDITLYLIRQGHTGKAELKFIRQLHDERRLPNMNLIFNGIQNGKYGYGYHYDYGYYDVKKNQPSFSVKDLISRF